MRQKMPKLTTKEINENRAFVTGDNWVTNGKWAIDARLWTGKHIAGKREVEIGKTFLEGKTYIYRFDRTGVTIVNDGGKRLAIYRHDGEGDGDKAIPKLIAVDEDYAVFDTLYRENLYDSCCQLVNYPNEPTYLVMPVRSVANDLIRGKMLD